MPRRNYLALAMIASMGLFSWEASYGGKPRDEMLELYGLFVDAVEKVEVNYVRPVSRRELLESALEGMLQQLDPHSTFINTSEWSQFRRQLEGRFGGIGIQVDVDRETQRLRVVAPMVGTPAYEAGVLAGDQIMEIDGQTSEGMSPDRAVEVLTGRPGTPVKLTVLHEGIDEPETVTITRAIIEVPSILGDHRKPDDQWDFFIDKDRKIAYVRISSFVRDTAEDLKKVLDQLKDQGMRGLVLDLRDDPGGLLSAAIEVVDLFLDRGEIVSTKGRNTAPKTYSATKDSPYGDLPLVVMVNQNSASASEIVSAALQDHHRATIVGQRSYGKGSVQNIFELDDGNSVLKLTVASYYRPSGENIHRFKNARVTDKWGVSPDPGCEVKLTPTEYHKWAIARHDRDRAAGHRHMPAPSTQPEAKPEPAKAKAKAEDKDKPKAETGKDQKHPAASQPNEPFVDKPLEKALDVIRGKLAPKAKAA
ncbi:MAG: S41 family peptidase [Isosphaeraceae bacterium]